MVISSLLNYCYCVYTTFIQPDEVEDRLLKNSFIQVGYEQGREEGTQEKTIELTINMLKENIDINAISKITGLSIDEINKLKDNL